MSHLPEQLAPLLSRLRGQHGALSEVLQSISPAHGHHRTPFQETIDEESTPGSAPAHPSWKSYRSSVSTVSDGGSVFFDAQDEEGFGAEEYVVREDQEDLASTKDTPSIDTKSASIQEVGDEAYSGIEDQDETPEETPSLPVNRRTRLPAGAPTEEGSLFTILKKNVGQVHGSSGEPR